MEIKEIKDIIDEASKSIITKADGAETKAQEALTKAAEFLAKVEQKADKTEIGELQKQFDSLSTIVNLMKNQGGW